MPVVEFEGETVYYETNGSGDPIVWLPGTAELGSIWDEYQIPFFSQDFECISIDLPGAGRSSLPAELSVSGMALAVAAVLDRRQDTAAHIVGFSLGASVAQKLAILRPDLVRSLTLIGSWSSTAASHHIRRHTEARLYSLENSTPDVYRQFGYWMISPVVFDEEPELRDHVERLLGAHVTTDLVGLAKQYRATLAYDISAELDHIQCPVFLLYGEEDLIAFPRYGRSILHAVPGAKTLSIPRAGHLVIFERPDEVNSAIDGFIHSLYSPTLHHTSKER